jgi:hypothetical protein
MIPRSNRPKANSNTAMEFSAYIITRKTANTLTKKSDFYMQALKDLIPELFPIDLTQDSDGNFVEVKNSKPKSKPKPAGPEEPPKPLDLNQSIALIKSSSMVSEITSDTCWVCVDGRGGNRCIGVYDSYFDKWQARFLTQGVSGGFVLRADNHAEGWSLVNLCVPGVDCPAKLRLWHMCIPHTESNKSPTWSDYDGERFHRQGAAAYTFCENDDQEMLESRMAATYRVTGSYEGQIDKREYYYAYLADFKEKLAIMNRTAGPKSTEEDNADEETMPNSQEDNFTSPDDKDEVNRTPQKKRKVSQPPSAAAAAAPIFASPHKNSIESPVHVVMALPVTGTVVDVLAFFNQFQTGFGRGHVSLCRYAPFPEFPSALIDCANSAVAENLCEFISTHALFGKSFSQRNINSMPWIPRLSHPRP